MNKQEQDVLKKEQQRAEREARIKALRNNDGSKKRLKQKSGKSVLTKVLLTAGCVVLALAAILYFSWFFGVPQRTLTAARVADQNIKVTEYNFAYFSTYNTYNRYFGNGGLLNLNADASKVTGEKGTWREFFRKSAEKTLQHDNVMYSKALAAGYKLEDNEKKMVDNYINKLKKQVGTPLDFELYIENAFGKGMTEKAMRAVLEKQAIAGKYASDLPDTYQISSADVDAEYQKDKNAYDLITYHSYLLKTPTTNADGKSKSTEEIETAKKKTGDLAKEEVAKLKKPEDLKAFALKQAAADEKKMYEGESDPTLHKDVPTGTIPETEAKTWLLDAARKAGDKTSVAVGNNFELLYFVSREKDTRKTADARIAYFNLRDKAGKKLSAEEIEKVRKAAQSLLTTIKTADDFKKYDAEAAKDGVPKAEKSIEYEKVDSSLSARLEPQVVDAILAPGTKADELKLLETDNALYLIFIEKVHDKECAYQMAENKLKKDAYTKDFDAWIADPANALKPVYPGYWFTGK